MQDYVSLHNLSCFSIGQSLIEPSEVFKKVKDLQQSAFAITDCSSLAASWDGLKYSKEARVKLIQGLEAYFVDDLANSDNVRLRQIVLLATNHQGYKNLLKLNRTGFDYGILYHKKFISRIDWKLLEQYSEGLICLTGGGQGILPQLINTRRADLAKEQAKKLKDIFGNRLGLEIQPHNMKRNATPFNDYEDQRLVNDQLIKMGKELDIKVVAATNAMYMSPEDWDDHDTYSCIITSKLKKEVARLKFDNEFYLKTREQIVKFFSRNYKEQAEIFCDNSLYFAEMCKNPEWIDPKFSNPSGKELPTFPVKDQLDYQEFLSWFLTQNQLKEKPEDVAYLRYCCEKKFDEMVPKGKEVEYRLRLENELEVLELKDLCGYLLIVSDYLSWARKNKIPTGEGRGSCASSLAAYLIEIHKADPIKYGLIFERFYNRNKTGDADCDCDFSKAGKPLVEQYVYNKYGNDYCAQITNYAKLRPKPYAKAIARVYMYGGDRKTAVIIGNAIADSIPKDIHSVAEALAKAPLFAAFANSEKYKELKLHAKNLGEIISNLSTHAGGTIICQRPLTDIVPIRKSKDKDICIEYEKERVAENKLYKMDLLGLSTLDIVQDVYNIIKFRNKSLPKIPWNYDENDKKTYELISNGNLFGIFQFGTSAGTMDLCRKIKPKCMEDLAIITALARPGVPKEFRDQFIETKFSNKKIEFLHPCLERSLKATYGIPIFDEVMLTLGEDVAGWDLNESDRLRKFIKDKGKHPEKDEKLKKDFIASTIKNGIEPKMANKLWEDLFANFAAYLFNKSHAITYSMLSYQTAYLKAHYPLEFLIANLNYECQSNAQDSPKNRAQIKSEIRALNVNLIPPSLNNSSMSYSIVDDNTVMTGLDALKFIGKDAIPEIIAKRPFASFEDFLVRVDARKVRAPAIQALAASGSLDEFGLTRKQMFLYSKDYRDKLKIWLKRKGKDVLFQYPWPKVEEWSVPERYALEVKYLGEGLLNNYREVYPNFFTNRAVNFKKLAEKYPSVLEKEKFKLSYQDGSLEAIVTDYYEFKVKKEDSKFFGQDMARITVKDLYNNSSSLVIFSDRLGFIKKRMKEIAGSKFKLEEGTAIAWIGDLNWYQGNISFVVEDIKKLAFAPSPPKDLKPQQVKMKIVSDRKKKKENLEQLSLLEEIEEELIEEGDISLENESLEEIEEEKYWNLEENIEEEEVEELD